MKPEKRYYWMVSMWVLAMYAFGSAFSFGSSANLATTRPSGFEKSLAPATTIPSTPAPRYIHKFDTMAHHMLDLEAEVNVVPDTKYQLLDQILADMKSRVHFDSSVTDPSLQRSQVLRALQNIDEVLTDHNVIYPPGDWIVTLAEGLQPRKFANDDDYNAALSHAHTERRRTRIHDHRSEDFYYMDCDILSFMYMATGEIVGLDLKLVTAPQHNFVRYHLDTGHYIDWETTSPMETSDDLYMSPHVTTESIRDRVYLSSMTFRETMGYFYRLRGDRCEKLKVPNFAQAAADYARAVEMYPQDGGARNQLAWLYVANPGFWHGPKIDAVSLALRAVSIDPFDGENLDTLACTYAEAGDFAKAISFEQDAIKLFVPDDPATADDVKQFKIRLKAFQDGQTYISIGGDPAFRRPPTSRNTGAHPAD